LSATCLFLSVWGLTPLLAVLSSRYLQETDSFPTWSVTSQCAFGQVSVVHSRPDGRKEEEWIDNAKIISPSKSSAGNDTIWKSIIKICVRTESLSVYYVYLKVTKGHNCISSWSVQPNLVWAVLICKYIFL